MSEHDYEAETRFLWEWAANSSALRMPDPLPEMRWDADDASLRGEHDGAVFKFYVEVVVRHTRRLIAVIQVLDAGFSAKETRQIPEVVVQVAWKTSAESAPEQTFWNYEPTPARPVRVVVGPSPKATWWCADLEGDEREAVEVFYRGKTFYLDNEDGSGWAKVTAGRGGPEHGHRSLPVAMLAPEPPA